MYQHVSSNVVVITGGRVSWYVRYQCSAREGTSFFFQVNPTMRLFAPKVVNLRGFQFGRLTMSSSTLINPIFSYLSGDQTRNGFRVNCPRTSGFVILRQGNLFPFGVVRGMTARPVHVRYVHVFSIGSFVGVMHRRCSSFLRVYSCSRLWLL